MLCFTCLEVKGNNKLMENIKPGNDGEKDDGILEGIKHLAGTLYGVSGEPVTLDDMFEPRRLALDIIAIRKESYNERVQEALAISLSGIKKFAGVPKPYEEMQMGFHAGKKYELSQTHSVRVTAFYSDPDNLGIPSSEPIELRLANRHKIQLGELDLRIKTILNAGDEFEEIPINPTATTVDQLEFAESLHCYPVDVASDHNGYISPKEEIPVTQNLLEPLVIKRLAGLGLNSINEAIEDETVNSRNTKDAAEAYLLTVIWRLTGDIEAIRANIPPVQPNDTDLNYFLNTNPPFYCKPHLSDFKTFNKLLSRIESDPSIKVTDV